MDLNQLIILLSKSLMINAIILATIIFMDKHFFDSYLRDKNEFIIAFICLWVCVTVLHVPAILIAIVFML